VTETSGTAQIVVAEDDDDSRELICAVLEQRGFAVAAAPWASGAFDLAKSLKPDLLVLDLGLPDASGADTVRRFRDEEEFAEVPILLVSAETRGPALAEALAAGADSYVPKPFRPAALAEAVARLVEGAT
jgi:two-component system OmpR family response regulator